jgi:chromosome segregation ATPase
MDSTAQEALSEMSELREKAAVFATQMAYHDEIMAVKEQQLHQLSLKYEELRQAKKERELSDALNYEKEQSKTLTEEIDKLKDRVISLVQSNEELEKEQQMKILELGAQLQESKNDAMQIAKRERHQTRIELENEITSSKQCVKRLTEELEGCKQDLDKLEKEYGKKSFRKYNQVIGQ